MYAVLERGSFSECSSKDKTRREESNISLSYDDIREKVCQFPFSPEKYHMKNIIDMKIFFTTYDFSLTPFYINGMKRPNIIGGR
jgi:hypothetical protein